MGARAPLVGQMRGETELHFYNLQLEGLINEQDTGPLLLLLC